MTLIEHSEPIFQFVCRLERIARSEGALDATLSLNSLKRDVDRLFRRFDYEAIHDDDFEGDVEQWKQLLRHFVDTLIARSGLSLSDEWKREFLAAEHDQTGDFFRALEIALGRNDLEAKHQLQVFHTCIGLGYASDTKNESQLDAIHLLEERVEQIAPTAELNRLSPNAYEHTNDQNYMDRPLPKLVFFGMLLLCLLGIVFFLIFESYTSASQELVNAVDSVLEEQGTTQP